MKILEKYNIEEIQSKLDESISFREFLIKIGSSTNGSGSYVSIKNQLIKLGIKVPYFNYENENKIGKKRENVFIEKSTYSRQHLKERIIKNKLIDYICEYCGNFGEWNGVKLSLHLEHKNGINDDNRLENLCFLCPNCHSQTETYSGKNKKKKTCKIKKKKICKCGAEIFKNSEICQKCFHIQSRKVERPTYEQLLKEIGETNYSAVGRKYGVSDNCIRKWIKYYIKQGEIAQW